MCAQLEIIEGIGLPIVVLQVTLKLGQLSTINFCEKSIGLVALAEKPEEFHVIGEYYTTESTLKIVLPMTLINAAIFVSESAKPMLKSFPQFALVHFPRAENIGAKAMDTVIHPVPYI